MVAMDRVSPSQGLFLIRSSILQNSGPRLPCVVVSGSPLPVSYDFLSLSISRLFTIYDLPFTIYQFMAFKLHSTYQPKGDQPPAIEALVRGS